MCRQTGKVFDSWGSGSRLEDSAKGQQTDRLALGVRDRVKDELAKFVLTEKEVA